jgi:hypothetical protein
MSPVPVSPAWQTSHGTFGLRVGYAEGIHGLTARPTGRRMGGRLAGQARYSPPGPALLCAPRCLGLLCTKDYR